MLPDNVSPTESKPVTAPAPVGILVSQDLMFISKVTGTAAALGIPLRAVGSRAAVERRLREDPLKFLILDLTAGALTAPERIAEYRRLAEERPGLGLCACRFVAYGPHVEGDALKAAGAAGCDEVMPRSKFSMNLPILLRGWAGESE